MSRNSIYYNQYIGPTFLVSKTEKKQYTIKKTMYDCCGNKKCKHYMDNTLTGFSNFCTACGKKIQSFKTEIEVQLRPHLIDKEKSKNLFYPFDNIPIDSDNFIYVPYFDKDKIKEGFLSFQEYENICNNKNCDNFELSTNVNYKFCPDCGKKNKLKNSTDYYGVFKNKKIKEIFKKYGHNGMVDTFNIVKDDEFSFILKDYIDTKECKNYKDILEKCYGKNSVQIVIASVKYIETF